MENPNIKTTVIHSKSRSIWYVVGTELGRKYKIASCEYVITGNEIIDTVEKNEALIHAKFISRCFNKSNELIALIQ